MRQNECQERPRPPPRGSALKLPLATPLPSYLQRQGGTGKRWANDLDIIAILSYLVLSSSISCISCYLKASCFRPKPLQKHQQPPMEKKVFFRMPPSKLSKIKQKSTKIKASKSISKKYPGWNSQGWIMQGWNSQGEPFWPPKPLQNLPKSSPRDLLAASWTLLATKP